MTSYHTLSRTAALVLLSLSALATASCGASSVKKTRAQIMAASLKPILPKSLEGGSMFKAADAEGDLLILTVEVPATQILTSTEMSKMNAAAFCQSDGGKHFIEAGGKVRFDVSVGGGGAPVGETIDHCEA